MKILERLVQRIEGTEALDAVGDPLADAVGQAIPSGPVKDLLSGTLIRHPLHPAVVAVPIGATVAVTALDFLGGDPGGTARRRLLGLALLSSLPAAAAGAADWGDTTGGERRVGVVHAALNTVGLGFFTASWLARRRRPESGKVLALAGLGILSSSSWLGGHLSYALGVGIDVTAFESGPSDWTEVARRDDLEPDQPVAAKVDGVTLLVMARSRGDIVVLADRCTHRGGPLHEGEVDGGCVTCPWHASRFRLDDGEIVRGPATRPQPVYEVRVVDGAVQARRQEVRSLRTNPV